MAVTLCGRGSFPLVGFVWFFFPAFQMTETRGCSHTGEESLRAQSGVKVPDGGCSGKSTGREGQRPRMRTEGPVLSLAASPTLWDQHSIRGRVGRQPRDGGGVGGGTGS